MQHAYRVKDIYGIRRENLAWVCAHKADKNQSELARKIDVVANLVSRYLKNKPIGDDIARKVESTYGLTDGWMDNVHQIVNRNEAPPDSLSSDERNLIAIFRSTNKQGRDAIWAVARSQDPGPTKSAARK